MVAGTIESSADSVVTVESDGAEASAAAESAGAEPSDASSSANNVYWSALSAVMRMQSIDCFSGTSSDTRADQLVGLLHGQLRDQHGRLQAGGEQLAVLDRLHRVRAAVEAGNRDLVEKSGGLDRGNGAERHRVVAGNDPVDVRMLLEQRLNLGERLVLAPVRCLLSDALEVRVLIEHTGHGRRPHAGVRVRLLAGQLDVRSRAVESGGELLRHRRHPLGIVGDDLGGGDARGVDLAVDQEHGNSRVDGTLDGGDRRIGSGVVEHDRCGALVDRRVDQLTLPIWVVVVCRHARFVAQRLGLCLGGVGLGLEERVVVRRRDDGDQALARGRFRRRLGQT